MDLNFDGDSENISQHQLNYIRQVLQEMGYQNNKVLIEPVGKAGDNYIASVKKVIIEDGNGIFKMIAKIAPQNEMMRMATSTQLLFKNEHHMYTEVLPKFRQLQIDANVDEEYRLKFADCYGSLSEPPNEVILLEDLTDSNFTMLDRLQTLSYECVTSVLKNFAIFHSLSFVIKNKEPETFKEIKNNLFDMWADIDRMEEAKAFFGQLENESYKILQIEEHKKAVNGAITQAVSMAHKFSKSSFHSKQSVIQHGDSWTNNIMFKQDKGNPQESILIDYQLSKESSPVCDILYLIFNCTDHKSRLQYYHDWIDYYHKELDTSLSNYGLKANLLYPRDQLDADLKRYSKMMFGLSIILANVTTMKSEDAGKMKEAMENVTAAEMMENYSLAELDKDHTQLFKSRLEGLIDSCLEFGLL